MQRLNHRAEILLQSRCLGGGDRERVSRLHDLEAEETRRRGSRAERSERRGAVPSAPIVPRVHRAPQARLDFESDDVGLEQRAARCVGELGRREAGGDERRARVRERDEAHVVEVVRVRRGAIRQRRRRGARAEVRAENPAPAAACLCDGGALFGGDDLLDDPCGRFGCAGEHHADRVEDGTSRDGARRLRRRRVDDEACKAQHSAFPIAAMKRCLIAM